MANSPLVLVESKGRWPVKKPVHFVPGIAFRLGLEEFLLRYPGKHPDGQTGQLFHKTLKVRRIEDAGQV